MFISLFFYASEHAPACSNTHWSLCLTDSKSCFIIAVMLSLRCNKAELHGLDLKDAKKIMQSKVCGEGLVWKVSASILRGEKSEEQTSLARVGG